MAYSRLRIMDVALPPAEAEDLTCKAAFYGMPTEEYVGIQALAGAYGIFHPMVLAFFKRANLGQSGTETPGEGES